MNNKINYSVDDFGVLRVYRGNVILFEAQDFLSTPKSEIEKFIDENDEGDKNILDAMARENVDYCALCWNCIEKMKGEKE